MSLRQSPRVPSIRIDEEDVRLSFHSHHERNLFSIRRPGWRDVQPWVVGESLEIFPIHIDQVEVWVSFEVGGESNLFTIRRPGGRKVDGLVLSDLFDIGTVEIRDEDLLACLPVKPHRRSSYCEPPSRR